MYIYMRVYNYHLFGLDYFVLPRLSVTSGFRQRCAHCIHPTDAGERSKTIILCRVIFFSYNK